MRKVVYGSLAVTVIGGGVASAYAPANAATRHQLVAQSQHGDNGYGDVDLGRITGLGSEFFSGDGPVRVDENGRVYTLPSVERGDRGHAGEPMNRPETSAPGTRPGTRTLPGTATKPAGNATAPDKAGNATAPDKAGNATAPDKARNATAPKNGGTRVTGRRAENNRAPDSKGAAEVTAVPRGAGAMAPSRRFRTAARRGAPGR